MPDILVFVDSRTTCFTV